MSRRSRFNAARRRRVLGFQVADRLDQQLESRSTVTPVGATALAIGAGTGPRPGCQHACNGGGNDAVMGSAGLGAGRSPAGQGPVSADEDFIPSFDRPAPAGGGSGGRRVRGGTGPIGGGR